MVAWFAGLFHLFRLFVYHTENLERSDVTDQLKLMARRAYRGIATPALVGTVGFGAAMLVVNPAYLGAPWLRTKLVLVAGLVAYHVFVGWVRRRFERGDVFLSSRQCRMLNEAPTLFLIPIILLAVLKPWPG